MRQSKLDERIRRADELAAAHPFAAEVLHFYKRIANLQKGLYTSQQEAMGNGSVKKPSRLVAAGLDCEFLIAKFPEFLSAVEAIAPGPIAQAAQGLKAQSSSRWNDRFAKLLFGEPDLQVNVEDAESLLVIAFLQPYAEFLADHRGHSDLEDTAGVCPFCQGRPLVGVLRPEGDGAKRSLICSLCSTEWRYGRIRCPACGEEAVEKLAIYTASQFPHVRVEACDTCRRYIKTVDLTKNGLAVPVVDELATLPLNLWAQEHEYVKVQVNLLGI